ncbi:MAG: hypothetical protein R3F56_08105 [Planctomycetota bacterium]
MRFLALVLPVILASALPAQSSEVHPDKQRVLEEVLRKRDDMRSGKTGRFNVRVRVKLKNGAKLNGVVKNGRLVEREEGIDFVETDRQSPDAGIRLYYFDETTSFVFLRWEDIAQHKVLVRLTDDEVRAIEREFAERERKRREVEAQLRAARSKQTGEKKGEQGEVPAKVVDDVGKSEEAEPSTPLLTEFPASEGWGETRVKEIERRRIAVGVFPNAKEKRFLEVYGEWKQQAAARQAYEAKVTKPAPPARGSK